MSFPSEKAERILRRHEVRERTGLSNTTIWRLEKQGKFPKRRKLTPSNNGAVGWLESEIARWERTL